MLAPADEEARQLLLQHAQEQLAEAQARILALQSNATAGKSSFFTIIDSSGAWPQSSMAPRPIIFLFSAPWPILGPVLGRQPPVFFYSYASVLALTPLAS